MYMRGCAQAVCKWTLFYVTVVSLRVLEPIPQGGEETTILT